MRVLLLLLIAACSSDAPATAEQVRVSPRIDAQLLAAIEPSPVIANTSVTLRVLGMT